MFRNQEKKFIIQNKIDELKDKGHEMIQKWEDKSREFINNFTQLFGPDGTLVSGLHLQYVHFGWFIYFLQNNIWTTSTGRIKRALSPAPSPPSSPEHQRASSSSSSSSLNGDSKHRNSSSRNGDKHRQSRKMAKRDSLEKYSDDEDDELFDNGKLQLKHPQEVWWRMVETPINTLGR